MNAAILFEAIDEPNIFLQQLPYDVLQSRGFTGTHIVQMLKEQK